MQDDEKEPVLPIINDMFEDVETVNDDENVEPSKNSPFGVAPVDPLVFKKSTDSPELRAAAAYVPISSTPVERAKPPSEPVKQDYGSWTPGLPTGATEAVKQLKVKEPPTPKVKEPEVKQVGKRLKILFTTVAIVVPLAILAGTIYLGVILIK